MARGRSRCADRTRGVWQLRWGYRAPMDKTRTYPSGVPCWLDIEPADLDEAERFYGGLFGWTFANAKPPELPGYYVIAQCDGRDVAGLASPEPVSTGAWNTYIAADDVDAT